MEWMCSALLIAYCRDDKLVHIQNKIIHVNYSNLLVEPSTIFASLGDPIWCPSTRVNELCGGASIQYA